MTNTFWHQWSIIWRPGYVGHCRANRPAYLHDMGPHHRPGGHVEEKVNILMSRSQHQSFRKYWTYLVPLVLSLCFGFGEHPIRSLESPASPVPKVSLSAFHVRVHPRPNSFQDFVLWEAVLWRSEIQTTQSFFLNRIYWIPEHWCVWLSGTLELKKIDVLISQSQQQSTCSLFNILHCSSKSDLNTFPKSEVSLRHLKIQGQ